MLHGAASETSIAMAYRLADTRAARGATEALDMVAAMQVNHFPAGRKG